MIERREPINRYPQSFRLDVGWLGDHELTPSVISIEEDAELLARSLVLRLVHHPTSTYTLVTASWGEATCRRVLQALLRQQDLFPDHQVEQGTITVRMRAATDVAALPCNSPPMTRLDGLAALLAESAESVLREIAAVTSKQLQPTHTVRERQGLLFQ